MSDKRPPIPIPYPDKPGFSYDPTPMTHAFPGQPEDCFDLVNQYGTYNIQRTFQIGLKPNQKNSTSIEVLFVIYSQVSQISGQ